MREFARCKYSFDRFELDAPKRMLLRDGKPIALNPKAFDLLFVLVENSGKLLTKDDLYGSVWADQFVEESNLTVNMSAIRKALGEQARSPRYIQTISGKGYRFVGNVRELELDYEPVDEIITEERFERMTLLREETFEQSGYVENIQLPGTPSPRPSVIMLLLLLLPILSFGGYWLFTQYSKPESRPAMTITRITDGKVAGVPTISPDGKFIAWVENAADSGVLTVQQTDTNTLLRLMEPGKRNIGCTAFSPDGKLIYYRISDERHPSMAFYGIPVLGGQAKKIVEDLVGCPSLSFDGKRVAFYRNDEPNRLVNIMIAQIDGGGEEIIFSRGYDEISNGQYLAFHPDGNLVAFNADLKMNDQDSVHAVYGLDLNTGRAEPLFENQFSEFGQISWTHDGQYLIFVARRFHKLNQLYLMNYPSRELRQITNDLDNYGNNGLAVTADSSTLVASTWRSYSEISRFDANQTNTKGVRMTVGTYNGRKGLTQLADGRIVYSARASENHDLWIANEDGSDAKALTHNEFEERYPTGSPDGRYLIYSSDLTGTDQLFRMRMDVGPETEQITFGNTDNTRPDISPDGKWIVYQSSDGQKNSLRKMQISGGESIEVINYECLAPKFSPDGNRIACEIPSKSRAVKGRLAIISAEGGQPMQIFDVLPFTQFPNLDWAPDGRSIVFRNWQNLIFNVWQQPLSGSEPKPVTNLTDGEIAYFTYSNDGKSLLISHGDTNVDVIMIKNFR